MSISEFLFELKIVLEENSRASGHGLGELHNLLTWFVHLVASISPWAFSEKLDVVRAINEVQQVQHEADNYMG